MYRDRSLIAGLSHWALRLIGNRILYDRSRVTGLRSSGDRLRSSGDRLRSSGDWLRSSGGCLGRVDQVIHAELTGSRCIPWYGSEYHFLFFELYKMDSTRVLLCLCLDPKTLVTTRLRYRGEREASNIIIHTKEIKIARDIGVFETF